MSSLVKAEKWFELTNLEKLFSFFNVWGVEKYLWEHDVYEKQNS